MDHEHQDSDETEEQRHNRQLDQLLQELRVAMPGVQVLFAFLLTVPFQQRFAQISDFQQDVYFGTLPAAALASALFAGPWFVLGIVRRMSTGRGGEVPGR